MWWINSYTVEKCVYTLKMAASFQFFFCFFFDDEAAADAVDLLYFSFFLHMYILHWMPSAIAKRFFVVSVRIWSEFAVFRFIYDWSFCDCAHIFLRYSLKCFRDYYYILLFTFYFFCFRFFKDALSSRLCFSSLFIRFFSQNIHITYDH